MLKPPLPSYVDVIPLLQSHELHNKGHQENLGNPSMAFYSQKQYGGNKRGDDTFTSKGKGYSQSSQKAALPPIQGPNSKDKSSINDPNTIGKFSF